ncbi:hypothetical protein J6590_102847 [Homalodisca vitripennis]|nr:hypothetical protein J6590_102847 [Homalodisca vitripennis]
MCYSGTGNFPLYSHTSPLQSDMNDTYGNVTITAPGGVVTVTNTSPLQSDMNDTYGNVTSALIFILGWACEPFISPPVRKERVAQPSSIKAAVTIEVSCSGYPVIPPHLLDCAIGLKRGL